MAVSFLVLASLDLICEGGSNFGTYLITANMFVVGGWVSEDVRTHK